jgi:hypothetical protein
MTALTRSEFFWFLVGGAAAILLTVVGIGIAVWLSP